MSDLHRREISSANTSYGFTHTLQDDKGSRVVRRFESSADDTKWVLVESEGEDLTDLQVDWSVPRSLSVESVESMAPRYCEQSETHWIYCAKAPVSVDVEDEQQANQANQLAQTQLSAQLWVNKAEQRIVKIRIFNRETLHPSTLASVDRFEIELDFLPAWQNGPLVTIQASRRLKGKYGFFISLDEHLTQIISDIVALQ